MEISNRSGAKKSTPLKNFLLVLYNKKKYNMKFIQKVPGVIDL